ncbi:flagellin N-terminal helical domain-containing protein [Salinibacter ruber]|uniref:flagellin N-terminal helical domain-containing protein n=1 Tax=Salinibacter ruber TaxID=146919 RepID=UPI002073E379|nr:flagellin [Salinibacter ruber]
MSNAFAINTNIQSQQAFQNLSETNDELSQLRQRLTTGLRINEASDDAAGFEIANQLEARTGAQEQALRNIGDSKSLLSTAEGSLDSQLNILQTMREKATQAANDSLGSQERKAIQGELDELTSEVQDIAKNTTFNEKSLIDSGGQDLTFQTGADKGNTFEVSLQDSTATGSNLSIGKDASILVNENGGTVKNTSVDSDSIVFGSDPSITDGSGNTLDSASNIITDTSSNSTPGRLVDGLEGGDFNISLTRDGSVGSDGGFRAEVGGSDGSQQTLELDGSGSFTGNGRVTLETDGGKAVEVDFSSNVSDLKNALSDGDTGEVTAEVGGDGIEFKNDVAQNETERKNAISNIKSAIDSLTGQLSDLGATQNRLSFKESNLETTRTNLESAQSRIEDADFAQTQTEVAKLQVQQQSGTAQLAQANAAGQSVLSLLGG